MEDAKEYLSNLETNIAKLEQSNGEQVIANSKAVGTYVTKEDNLVGKTELSETGKEAFEAYETRLSKLNMPSQDDSSEMDDIVAEKIADDWIDSILGTI